MSWDPVRWAATTGVEAGPTGPPPPAIPVPQGGVIAIDRDAWLALVQPTAALATAELELRAAGWTLGPLPEGAETMAVVTAVSTDAPTLAGAGAGFLGRRFDESSQGIRLRIRPIPAAQSGCAVLVPGFRAALDGLRLLAQSNRLPAEAIAFDRAAAGLWLDAAEVGPQTSGLLRADDALIMLVGQGDSGRVAEQVAASAMALAELGAETLGQEVAQAWAATRDRVVAAAPALLAAGWLLERREARRPWGDAGVDVGQADGWVGLEATGADAHSVLLRARRLSAAG